MSRPIMCDDCGCTIEKPFVSVKGHDCYIEVRKAELCTDCVLVRVKRVLGIEDETDPEEITAEVYGVEA